MGTFKNPDVWKQNLAYQIGDFVLYNGTVYMAIKPVPAGTEMSADYWTDFSGGGSGSSDFTTAHVTVTSTVGEVGFEGLTVCAYATVGGNTPMSMPHPPAPAAPAEFDVILYKGSALLQFNYSIQVYEVEVSGAIQQMSAGVYVVTGDCTIAITDHTT